jgi:hypothetical protein
MAMSLFLASSICLCSAMHAIQPEKIETLSAKVVLSNTNGYFVFADNSCWKVVRFSKRWRSLREWWNGVRLLVPETFDCVPDDWELGSQIEVYPKQIFPGIPEENASNKLALKNCSHVFVNSQTQQILFGISLKTAECITQLFIVAHQEGYDEGYSAGYADGYGRRRLSGSKKGLGKSVKKQARQ